MQRDTVDPFQYADYRKLLAAYYHHKKHSREGFSFRLFARKVGLRTPNHLKLVIDGQRNLTDAMAMRYAKAMGLVGEQAEFFLQLVAFNQAKTSTEREERYKQLRAFKGYRKAQKIDVAHSEYYANWWLPAIREMVLQRNFRLDPEWIGKQLIPPISKEDAAKAISTLLQAGLLAQQDPEGTPYQQQAVLTTGAETAGVHVALFHKAMMQKAAESIDAVRPPDRDISSLTFCTSKDGLAKIKARIQEFRKELIALMCVEDQGEQVVQLNMQLFPLTQPASNDENKP